MDLAEKRAARSATSDRLRAAIKRLISALRDPTLDLELRTAIELLLAAFNSKQEEK